MALQRVCAWCSEVMGGPLAAPASGITHGICEDCRDYFFGDDDGAEPLEEFLERLPVPILVVDPDGRILIANHPARALMGKDLEEARGIRGGEVMECAYARLPEGCGRTVHCDGCAIRNTVEATYADGVSRHGVEAFQELCGPSGVQRTRILIGTEKVGEVVLLRIDSIRPALQAGSG